MRDKELQVILSQDLNFKQHTIFKISAKIDISICLLHPDVMHYQIYFYVLMKQSIHASWPSNAM